MIRLSQKLTRIRWCFPKLTWFLVSVQVIDSCWLLHRPVSINNQVVTCKSSYNLLKFLILKLNKGGKMMTTLLTFLLSRNQRIFFGSRWIFFFSFFFFENQQFSFSKTFVSWNLTGYCVINRINNQKLFGLTLHFTWTIRHFFQTKRTVFFFTAFVIFMLIISFNL